MPEQNFAKFQRKRLSPLKGLIIDVSLWDEAHNYHRDQQRLHALSSHGHGVVTGLEVVAWNPPDNSVVIHPGVALDPEGEAIVVPEPQRFYVNTDEKGTARIIIRYSEIAPETTEISGEGKAKPVYVMEAFRIEERRKHLQESHIELARILLKDKGSAIKDADDPYRPGPGEIDTRHRTGSGARGGEITIGLLAYPKEKPADGWDYHLQGIFNLARSIRQSAGYFVRLAEMVELSSEISDCDLLCIAGHQEFQLSEAEEGVLNSYLNRGGVLFAEACAGAAKGQDQAKGFRSSFAGLCDRLGRNLRSIQRDHPLFQSHYIFASVPPGYDGMATVMENDGIIYSDSDYGCVWQGGREDKPLPRETIRDALEFGTNIAVYSHQRARLRAVKLAGL